MARWAPVASELGRTQAPLTRTLFRQYLRVLAKATRRAATI